MDGEGVNDLTVKKKSNFKKLIGKKNIYIYIYMNIFLLQDFPCPITLVQQETCDWTGKREVE